jgi:uncharacterized membrane protein YoaK (UPF0700 family)
MLITRGVIGGILLFLGRELNFLLAGSMAALIGLRLTPLLPREWPGWSRIVFIIGLAVIAAVIPLRNQRAGYFVSGFLAGGAILVEYYAPGVLTLPLLPFLVGGAIGLLIMGVFTEWALLVVSSLIGAYYVTNSFTLSSTGQILVGSGLFIIGALTQALIRRMQMND